MKGLATSANDGSVSVASQARLEAQEQGVSVRALDVGHEDILTSPDAIGRMNELLAERFRQQGEIGPATSCGESLKDQCWPGLL